MRFLIKRPRISSLNEELETVLSVMQSNFFVYLDILVFNFLLALLLSPILHSLKLEFIVFGCASLFFGSVYFFIFQKSEKTHCS